MQETVKRLYGDEKKFASGFKVLKWKPNVTTYFQSLA